MEPSSGLGTELVILIRGSSLWLTRLIVIKWITAKLLLLIRTPVAGWWPMCDWEPWVARSKSDKLFFKLKLRLTIISRATTYTAISCYNCFTCQVAPSQLKSEKPSASGWASLPWPPTRGSAPGHRWGPQTPVIGSRSSLAMAWPPPMKISAYALATWRTMKRKAQKNVQEAEEYEEDGVEEGEEDLYASCLDFDDWHASCFSSNADFYSEHTCIHFVLSVTLTLDVNFEHFF